MNPPDTQNKVAKKKRKPRKPSDNKLSPDQKRQNHVSSEQRRRQAMRETYDTLVELVPDLCDAEKRSEFMIYAKSMCATFVFFFFFVLRPLHVVKRSFLFMVLTFAVVCSYELSEMAVFEEPATTNTAAGKTTLP